MQNKDDVNRPCFAYISKLLNWGKCRSRNLKFFKLLKTAKRGFLGLEINTDSYI